MTPEELHNSLYRTDDRKKANKIVGKPIKKIKQRKQFWDL